MIKGLLEDSWSLFRKHVLVFAAMIFPIVVPLMLLTFFYQTNFVNDESGFLTRFTPELITLCISPIYTIAFTFYIASVITGEPISIKAAWQLGIKFWLPYLALLVLVLVLVCAGLVFLIIPGIYLAIKYSFAAFELLFDGKGPIKAMTSSWQLTNGYAGVIIGGGLILAMCFYIPYGIISLFFDQGSSAYWLFYYSARGLEFLFGALTTTFIFHVYLLASKQHGKSLDEDVSDADAAAGNF